MCVQARLHARAHTHTHNHGCAMLCSLSKGGVSLQTSSCRMCSEQQPLVPVASSAVGVGLQKKEKGRFASGVLWLIMLRGIVEVFTCALCVQWGSWGRSRGLSLWHIRHHHWPQRQPGRQRLAHRLLCRWHHHRQCARPYVSALDSFGIERDAVSKSDGSAKRCGPALQQNEGERLEKKNTQQML